MYIVSSQRYLYTRAFGVCLHTRVYMYILGVHILMQHERATRKRERTETESSCETTLRAIGVSRDRGWERKDALTLEKRDFRIHTYQRYRLRTRDGVCFRMIFQGTKSSCDFLVESYLYSICQEDISSTLNIDIARMPIIIKLGVFRNARQRFPFFFLDQKLSRLI